MNYRNRPLLDLAHKFDTCQLCGRFAPDGCEPAHSNWSEHGKGMSIKAHDCFFAAMCHDCHAALDQGKDGGRWEKWRVAADRTILALWRNGWLKVAK